MIHESGIANYFTPTQTYHAMKLARWLRLTTLTALGLGIGLTSNWSAAIATNFASAEVDQSRFVLLATAGGSRLTILEQVSNARSCWQANGDEVDVLLLNFDFTGICGRSSDLNGYSVRAAGQDLGSQYRLQVRTEGNAMVLYATPRRGGTSLEVGRTRSLPQEFGRIYLNPGWRIARRVYNGQALGHLYLANDQSEATLVANASRSSGGSTVVLQPSSGSGSSGGSNSGSIPVVVRPPDAGATAGTPPNPDDRSTRRVRRSRRNTSSQQPVAEVPRTPSGMPSANAPINIPVPEPETRPAPSGPSVSGSTLPPPPSTSGRGDVALVPVPVPPPTPSGDRPPGDSMIPVVPVTRDLAFGGGSPSYSTGTPQPATRRAADLGFGYRLIVSDSSPEAQRRVRSVVPDAFRTVINGEVVMQAGLFYNESEADNLLQRLSQENLPARLVPVN